MVFPTALPHLILCRRLTPAVKLLIMSPQHSCSLSERHPFHVPGGQAVGFSTFLACGAAARLSGGPAGGLAATVDSDGLVLANSGKCGACYAVLVSGTPAGCPSNNGDYQTISRQEYARCVPAKCHVTSSTLAGNGDRCFSR